MLVVVAKWHHPAILLTYSYSYSFFLDNSVQRGKGAMRLTPCEAPTRETRPDHYTGNSVPYSLQQVCGFFNFLVADYITLKMQETWPMINCPYPRRQEHLTIAGVIAKAGCSPECWSGRGLEPETSHKAVRCSTNWANQLAVFPIEFNIKGSQPM